MKISEFFSRISPKSEVEPEQSIKTESEAEDQSDPTKVRKIITHMVQQKPGDERKLTMVFFNSGAIKFEMQYIQKPNKNYTFFISKRTASLIYEELKRELFSH